MKLDDLFAQALPTPGLEGGFSDRVRKRALAELAPAASEATAPLSRTVTGLLVPALLMSAAVVRTTETVRVTKTIFGTHSETDKE